ncbi:MAG: hypothetical protein AB7E55_33240 [Pigmentiphaga sp.]
MTQQQIERLVRAAKAWAAFQEGDSLNYQGFDAKLKAEAIEARERLLDVIDDLPNS